MFARQIHKVILFHVSVAYLAVDVIRFHCKVFVYAHLVLLHIIFFGHMILVMDALQLL